MQIYLPYFEGNFTSIIVQSPLMTYHLYLVKIKSLGNKAGHDRLMLKFLYICKAAQSKEGRTHMNIETSRLILKDYTKNDFKYYWQLKSTEKVWEYSTFIPYKNEQEASVNFDKMLTSLRDNPYHFAALWTKEDGHFIGEAGILSLNQYTNRCVVGYNLLPDYWNLGYATEITKALVSYAFEDIGIERVEALAMSLNIASCKVLEKSGFTLEGILRHFTKIKDKYYDVCYYSIISSDFFIDFI